jgi:hypothetical protein
MRERKRERERGRMQRTECHLESSTVSQSSGTLPAIGEPWRLASVPRAGTPNEVGGSSAGENITPRWSRYKMPRVHAIMTRVYDTSSNEFARIGPRPAFRTVSFSNRLEIIDSRSVGIAENIKWWHVLRSILNCIKLLFYHLIPQFSPFQLVKTHREITI